MLLYKKKENTDIKCLENLYEYNTFLNLLLDNYSNKISRKQAETKKLEEEEVYIKNKEICESFFKKFGGVLNLEKTDVLKKFLIDKYSDEGEKLIDKYKNYIKAQNSIVKDILDYKHQNQDFPLSKEINIQSIEKEEIFYINHKEFSLTEMIFENSFREPNFRDIKVDYEKIEEEATEKLLNKKKILNDDIINVIYIDEKYLHENTSKYNEFVKKYNKK